MCFLVAIKTGRWLPIAPCNGIDVITVKNITIICDLSQIGIFNILEWYTYTKYIYKESMTLIYSYIYRVKVLNLTLWLITHRCCLKAVRRPVKLSVSSRYQLKVGAIKLDYFNLPRLWKYVTMVLMKCARNHNLNCFKSHSSIIMKNKTFKIVWNHNFYMWQGTSTY